MPAYLSLPDNLGGGGPNARTTSAVVIVMQVGRWFGYVTFGFISDALGRKTTYVAYLLAASAVLVTYGTLRRSLPLLIPGPFVAFFGTGYFTGFGAVSAEQYRKKVRATAQGITNNSGRIVSALSPSLVGSFAERHGFAGAFAMVASAFVIAAICWFWIPEPRRT